MRNYEFDGRKLFVYNYNICNQLNIVLRYYLDDNKAYTFRPGEQGVFMVDENEYVRVKHILSRFKQ